jgi:hypothetical protein
MGSLFKAPKPSVAAAGASAIEPPKPRVIRQPTETDPSILAAAQRTRRSALSRRGRLSTILTDNTRDTIGSSGQALGA